MKTKEMNKIAQKTKSNTITTTIIFDLGRVVVNNSDPIVMGEVAKHLGISIKKPNLHSGKH